MDTPALRARLGLPRRVAVVRALGTLLVAASAITTLAPAAGAQDDGVDANLVPGQPAPQVDSDGDGISNQAEVQVYGLQRFRQRHRRRRARRLGDELYNAYGYSYPNLYDSDYDGLSDLEEVACLFGYCTSAIAADTDFDGRSDRDDLLRQQPLDPSR